VSNVLKAIWKEYGIAGRQPARPFLAKATNDAEKQALDIIQRKFDEKAGAE
jgi:phage gpG-like protein